jgi:hypothetical protein
MVLRSATVNLFAAHIYMTFQVFYGSNSSWLLHWQRPPMPTFITIVRFIFCFLFRFFDFRSVLNSRDDPYRYVPTESVAITFIALYGVSSRESQFKFIPLPAYHPSVLHLIQACYYRLWWLLPTGLLEVAGWSGRLWSSFNPTSIQSFQLQ